MPMTARACALAAVLSCSSIGWTADASGAPEPITTQPVITSASIPVAGGGLLCTYFGRSLNNNAPVPLVSILRDSLGNEDPADDRLETRPAWGVIGTW